MRRLPLVVLFGAPSAFAADSQYAADWQVYKDTLERYEARSLELKADVKSTLERQLDEERTRVLESYSRAAVALDDQETALRKMAIARLEQFLAKYPASPETPEMIYRLADFEYEEAELEFNKKNNEYLARQEMMEQNPEIEIGEQPLKDYGRPIALYRELINRYPDYDRIENAYYYLGWCLRSDVSEQYDPIAARDLNEEVVKRFPGSKVAHESLFLLGEYYFELPGPREDRGLYTRKAIEYYQSVEKDGPSGNNYEKAIYKLGWSYYKLSQYDQAFAYMVKELNYSDLMVAETGRPSPTRAEAIVYLAISYADQADRLGRSPVKVAEEHLKKIGVFNSLNTPDERKWVHEVMARLADTLVEQANYEEAIAAYEFLQTTWPLHPDNPVYQSNIAQILAGQTIKIVRNGREREYKGLPVADVDGANAAQALLSEKYSPGSAWFEGNRNNSEAIAQARTFIEGSLASVAAEALIYAEETKNVADYAIAAQKYREFLQKVPFSDDYDEYQYYLAYALYSAQKFPEAEVEYQEIVKNDRSKYKDRARYQIMKCREEVLDATYGSKTELPPSAVVEKTVPGAGGKELSVYLLSDAHKALVESYDDLVDREVADAEINEAIERDRPAMLFISAQMYFKHNRFDEARGRFEKYLALYGSTPLAVDAAGNIIDSYTQEGNIAMVAKSAERFKNAKLGDGSAGATDKIKKFASVQEAAQFNLITEMVKAGQREEAAQAFLQFLTDFPQSEYRRDALYNAAYNLQVTGKADEANRRYEQYIDEYPTDEKSKALYFAIAGNYAAILELQKAIRYYEDLQRLFPDYVDAPVALFNGAFLRVGIGDAAGAARGFEKYATVYANQNDAEPKYWMAGEQWERVSDAAAIDFYNRYLSRYPNTDPNHILEAQYKLAKLYEKKGDRRTAAAWSNLQKTFMTYQGSNISQKVRGMAAEAALRDLQAQFETFKKIKFTTSEAKNVELITKTKQAELSALLDRSVAIIQLYQDYETAAAALYYQGSAQFLYADMVYDMPLPPGLTEDEEALYREVTDTKLRLPAEDNGKKFLQASLDKARSEKRWSTWNSKALEALHERFPLDYPSERQESRGMVQGSVVPIAGPATIPASEEKP